MNAVVYTRVSTHQQVDGVSLDNQEEKCLAWAHKNDVLVKQVFREEGVSAKTADRPQLQLMLDYLVANARDIDYLVIYAVDRLSRNTEDFFAITAILKKCKIELKDPYSNIHTQRTDKLIRYFQSITAELDNDVKSERVTDNMQRHAQEGFRMSKAPYGLRNVRTILGKSTVEPVPGVAELIALTLEKFSTGLFSIKELIEYASSLGLKRANGDPLNHAFVGKMLRQPLYAGLECSKHTNNELVPSVFEGLINEETYFRNQMILQNRKGSKSEVYTAIREEYPLRKFLKCANCGSSIRGSASTGSTRKKYPKYHCSRCPKSSITPDELHEQFVAHLANLAPSTEMTKLIKTMILRVWNDENASMRNQRKTVSEKLEKIDEQRSKLLAKFVNDEVTREEKNMMDQSLLKEKANLQFGLDSLQRSIGVSQDNIDYALSYMDNSPRLWNAASPEMKIRFQNLIFPEGLPYDFRSNKFGTSKLSPIYTLASIIKDPSLSDESLMVTSRRIELRLPG